MLDTLIDNLFRLEGLTQLIPSVIQIALALFWFFITIKLKSSYRVSLTIALVLIVLAMLVQLVNLGSIAGTIGQYAFIFLMIGILQNIFGKE